MPAKRSPLFSRKHNGQPSYRGTIVKILSQNGGEMMSNALEDALIAAGLRATMPSGQPRFKPSLWQMKNEGFVKYKADKSGGPYLVKLSTKAIMDLPPDHTPPPAALPISLPVPVTSLPARGARVREAEPAPPPPAGVAVHLVGASVSLYVNGNRHRFSRDEFGEVADLFSVFHKRP